MKSTIPILSHRIRSKIHSILLITALLVPGTLLWSYISEKDGKKEVKKEEASSLPTESGSKPSDTSQKPVKSGLGIPPIMLGRTIAEIELSLTTYDKLFSGFKGVIENHYYVRVNNLIGKKLDNPIVILKYDKIYYKKVVEHLLVSATSKFKAKKARGYNPKQFYFPTHNIHPKIVAIHLKFYEGKLYDCLFHIKLTVNEMNDLVERYHKKFYNEPDYDKVTETYTWKEENYQISLNVSGRVYPRIIKLQFKDSLVLESLWEDNRKIKEQIDSLLGKKKSPGLGDL